MPDETEFQHPTIKLYALSLDDLRLAQDSLEALHRRLSRGGKLSLYKDNTKWMDIIRDLLTIIRALRDQVVDGALEDCATEELIKEIDENRWRYHDFMKELNKCISADDVDQLVRK